MIQMADDDRLVQSVCMFYYNARSDIYVEMIISVIIPGGGGGWEAGICLVIWTCVSLVLGK